MTKPSRSALLAPLALFAVACGISATGELSPTPGNTAGSAGSSGIAGSPAGGASGNGGGPGGSGQGGVSGTSGQGGASGSDPGGAAGTGGAGTGGAGNAGVGGDGGAGGDSGSAGVAGQGGDSGSAGNAGVGGDGGTGGAGGDGGSAGNAGVGGDGGTGGDSGSAGVAGNAGVGGDSGAGGDGGSAGNAGAGGCAEGFLDCDGQASNSCETNVTQDKANCGACGQICGESNAEAICENSTCKLTCQGSFLDCDGQASSGCEVNGTADAKNCGACGKVCASETCSSGKCLTSIFPTAEPACIEGSSAQNIDLGVKFKASVAGTVTAIRFFKKESAAATYTVNLWDGSGKNLATAQIPIAGGQTGWFSVALPQPVTLVANQNYMASYKVPSGKYCYLPGVKEIQSAPLTFLLDNSYFNNSNNNQVPATKLGNTLLADVVFAE